MEGTANRFTTPSLATGTVIDSGHAYKVRMIVRRPSSAAKFSGKIVVEWFNVTNNFELDVQWNRAYEYFIRQGWAYVGVGVQRAGIVTAGNGLRAWNPSRYGTIDVTQGGTLNDDSLKYDIFSQAGQAVLHPAGVGSAGWSTRATTPHRNRRFTVDKQSRDLLKLRTSARSNLSRVRARGPAHRSRPRRHQQKVFKVISEFDANNGEVRIRRPDTDHYVTWEVAGSSHTDYHNFLINGPIRLRDEGITGTTPDTQNCISPARSRVNLFLVHQAAYDWISRWILTGQQPPSMPQPLTVLNFNTTPVTFARDSHGLALGGIQLADTVVPTALNNGWNTGGKPPTSNGSCQQAGTHVPFDQATVNALVSRPGRIRTIRCCVAAKKNASTDTSCRKISLTLDANVTAERLGQPQSEQLEAQKLGHPPFQF